MLTSLAAGAVPTAQDVADASSVSVATVSRVFNFPDKVLPATRKRVQAAAQRLGYLPNASARTLRTQRSRVLGVVLPTLLNPVFAEWLQGLAQAATLHGYSIVPLTTEYQLPLEERAVNLLLAGNVDGMILVVSNPARSRALKKLGKSRIPYVLAYNRHPAHPCVSVDGEQAVASVVAELVGLGHRRIAMVSGQLAASDRAQQRHRGYLSGMRAAGLKPALLEVPFVDTAAGEIKSFMKRKAAPTALVCSNDLLAIRSVRALRLAGLQVPGDVTVVGFDGIALGRDLTPALSTVVQPNAAIGKMAVELVMQVLASRQRLDATASVTLPWTFREGESRAPARQPIPKIYPPPKGATT
ncbi:MAG TPA: LacI family DNA-binding transcriptional regulator [Variovorax sp.]|nr:LacI family DNA-binding transcriptional regulator [Variovorax sp.]